MRTDIRIHRWEGAAEPTEPELRRRLEAEGLPYYAWSNGPHDHYTPHMHDYHKVLYVLSGSITFGLPGEGESLTLRPGDRLDLPAGVLHDAVVGPQGVLCLEGHR